MSQESLLRDEFFVFQGIEPGITVDTSFFPVRQGQIFRDEYFYLDFGQVDECDYWDGGFYLLEPFDINVLNVSVERCDKPCVVPFI